MTVDMSSENAYLLCLLYISFLRLPPTNSYTRWHKLPQDLDFDSLIFSYPERESVRYHHQRFRSQVQDLKVLLRS